MSNTQKKIEKLYKKTKKRGVRISFPFNYQSQIQLIKIEDIDEFIEKEGSLAYNDSNDSLIFFKNTGKDIFYFGNLNEKASVNNKDFSEVESKPKIIEKNQPEISPADKAVQEWLIQANSLLKEIYTHFTEEIDIVHNRLDKLDNRLKEHEAISKSNVKRNTRSKA